MTLVRTAGPSRGGFNSHGWTSTWLMLAPLRVACIHALMSICILRCRKACRSLPLCAAADIISAVEFDFDGQHLATGDRGGRVVLFEKVNTQPVSITQVDLAVLVVIAVRLTSIT